MGFLCFANGYIQRFCLSLAITEMVLPREPSGTSSSVKDPYACPAIVNRVNASLEGTVDLAVSPVSVLIVSNVLLLLINMKLVFRILPGIKLALCQKFNFPQNC